MGMTWTKEQEQVIKLRNRDLLVSAAAGSGKTAVLVERIIKKVTDSVNPIDIDRLLIVTFTRAAANEMRERISKAIEEQLEKNSENEHLQRQATLIHNAKINTIDGFCAYVIKNYFHTIDLDPSYRIAEEGELSLLKADVLAQVVEEEYAKADQEFIHFVECYANGKVDRVLEELVLELHNFSMSDPYPEEWLRGCLKLYDITEIKREENPLWLKLFWDEVDRAIKQIQALSESNVTLCKKSNGPFVYELMVKEVADYCELLMNATNYEECYKILKNLKFTALSRKKDSSICDELRERVKEQHTQAKDLLKALKEEFFLYSHQRTVEMIRENSRCIKMLIELTLHFQAAFTETKRQKGIMDFPDLEHITLQILVKREGEEWLPTQAALDFADQFEEIMIDEYQDSNLVQEYLLTAISRKQKGIDNMFMVGDVKQSIYRFRQARPELFMKKLDQYTKEESNTQRIDLHKNFRGCKNVLDTSNLIFRQLMGRDLGGVEYGQDAFLNLGADYQERENLEENHFRDTQVLCLDIEKEMEKEDSAGSTEGNRVLEARLIAGKIKELVGKEKIYNIKTKKEETLQYKDCVILLRTLSGWAEVFAKTLNDLGVPAYSTSKTGYFTALEIQTVLNFLHICDNPRQELPFTAILTSPIVGLEANDLGEIKGFVPNRPIYEGVKQYSITGEDEKLKETLLKFLELLESFRERVAYTPIHEFLNQLLEESGYLDYVNAMPGGEQRSTNLAMLVEKAIDYETTSYRGLFNFIRYIERLRKYDVDFGEASIINENGDIVRIMSIHKSKGLEFPVVFLAGLGKTFNMQDIKGNLVCHPECGIGLNYIDPTLRTKSSTIIRNIIGKQIKNENLGEELRILYVALTRAKEKLILSGGVKKLENKIKGLYKLLECKEELLPYEVRAGVTTYWDFLLPALARHEAFGKLFEKYFENITYAPPEWARDAKISINIAKEEDFVMEEVREQVDRKLQKDQLMNWDASVVYQPQLRGVIQERFSYEYPYLDQLDIPAKLSVSELKHEGMDQAGISLFPEEIVPILPKFMEEHEEKPLSGPLRGTAYHKALECLDFTRVSRAEDIKEQLFTCKEEGRMTQEMLSAVSLKDIQKFCNTELVKRMGKAQSQGNLYKEQPFVIEVPANKKDPKYSEEEMILVQGIIDLFFVEENEIVLLDYKTDRIQNSGQELVDKYKVQLEYYALALQQLMNLSVKEICIYSFTLGEVIYL